MHYLVSYGGMDFGLLPKSALEFVAALSIAFNVSAVPEANLTSPDLIASQNAGEIQSLDVLIPDPGIKLVLKEQLEPELVTVEQPPAVYTVIQPAPKPTPEPEEEKIEIIKEAKAQELSPTPSSSPSATPSDITSTDSNGEKMFTMVNEYRAEKGLGSFEKDGRLCEIARSRAPQVNSELSSGTLHKGFKELNLPYWATENIAAYSTVEENLHFWLSDYIHKKAIESDSKYSCVACSGSSCSQIFTSFVSK